MGEKFKTKVDFAELYSLLDQMDQTGGLSGLMQQDFSDYYNDFAMTSNADGTRTITFSIDAQKMNGLYDQILQGMGVSMPEGVSLTYRNLSCSAVVNPEGYLSDMTMKMGIDVKDSTSSVKMDLDLSVTYHQPGQPVSVVFPDDLEEYDELIGGADTPVSPQGPLDPNPQSDYVVLGYAPVVTSVSNLS